ncbi:MULTISPECIES: hypothetical protein [unclassified Paenibacillus]|uniref:hypothetical protein n=1 Tax=unclassified Paenibacillus TaxID=185978 RepID=UPI0024069F8A|nr:MULTISPECIES: hypothetical protein [unclassified Paenibacillus]MDF9841523.1 hypothetical protein [Paenibacillus sp. PastF-2]MDF9848112.1 hypothetical protein [Paenibacillus sp. PastM-2]MDF9854681.1 hypothetical protein [Paenibacillus sp. PastF-1]MDH6479711.1 hypothetical protein [Paenibacillus sp. PastH-2]MDH6507386.1 hypothetical protein [Paenibacillus sp. PastM-3]
MMRLKSVAGLAVGILAAGLLLTACTTDAKPAKLSAQEAQIMILEKLGQRSSSLAGQLAEITPAEVWEETGHQLFKDSSSLETYVVADGQAAVLGIGFGGCGVTSVVPYDVNGDGAGDLVYAYSYGSGIHRSVMSWMDLQTMTEQPVLSKAETAGFRTYDLILQKEDDSIIVYQVGNKQNREAVTQALMSYPASKDIESMRLIKDGVLVKEQDGLFYEATGAD